MNSSPSTASDNQNPATISPSVNPAPTVPAIPVNPGMSVNPAPIPASPYPPANTANNFPQSPYPYSDQTIAQELTDSHVIGQPVTFTDNQLSVRDKVPLMKISLLLIFIITGFSGSFLYFRFTSATPVNNTAMLPQPTVKTTSQNPVVSTVVTESPVNPFVSPAVSFINPFAPTPTEGYQNPFEETTGNQTGGNQPYQNPFEDLK